MKKLFMFIVFFCLIFTFACGSSDVSSGDVVMNDNNVADSVGVVEEDKYGKDVSDTVVNGVKFRKYYYEITESGNLIDEDDNTSQTVEFTSVVHFVLPAGDDAATEKIRQDLLHTFDYNSQDFEQKLDNEYARDPKVYDVPEDMQESEMEIMPISIVGDYVSYYTKNYFVFVGQQSHGWTTFEYSIYNMKTGEKISQDDILDVSEKNRMAVANKLRSLLVEYLESLDVDGSSVNVYDVNDLVNGNLYLSDEGLVYCYDPSEIVPYMIPAPELELSKEWLKPYLKVDGPLYQYWFGKK